ncbi:MAG: VOC family protein [Bryobacter sp.]|jgi:catechol 2,3-dioxygenase-like lactoylglutathione lyase family enzyme|nr:VOC family protein [Bryobacter sp. CoA8 C33]
MLQSVIAVLPSLDLDETIEFYKKLGFSVWSRHEDDYAILARESHEIHFFLMGHLNPKESFFGCYLRVSLVDQLYADFVAAEVPNLHPIEIKPWGMREFALIDPHGNLLRIGQEIE